MQRLAHLCTLILIGCTSAMTGPISELPFTSATNSCGPTDGPAVSITFSSMPPRNSRVEMPYVTVTILTAVDNLAGRTFRIGAASPEGYGGFVGENDRRVGAVAGTMRVNDVLRDSSIVGSANLTLADGSRIEGAFAAPWRTTRILCG
jgi:hypothetical protein